MKLKYEMNIINMDDEFVAVPICDEESKFKGIVRINETTKFILELLKEDTTVDKIIDAMLKEYDTTRNVLEKHVNDVLSVLSTNNLIE